MTVAKIIVAALTGALVASIAVAQVAKPDDKGEGTPMQGMRKGDKAGMSKHMNEMHKGDMSQHPDRMIRGRGGSDKPAASRSDRANQAKSKRATKDADHSAHHPEEKK